MRAVRIDSASRRIELVDVPAPSVGDGHVRVRIHSAGVCGSDLHMLDGGFPFRGTPGHELAGVAEDDTPVAIEPIAPCDVCDACRAGAYHLCDRGPEVIFGVGLDGGMAEELVVPKRCLVPLAKGLSPRDACLVEPLALAVHGFGKVGLRSGERVAIIGGGSVGLCATAVAVAAGAEVGLAARHDHQREAGARLGAREIAGSYDVVVECAGTDAALEQAVGLARKQARALMLATYWGGLQVPAMAMAMKELELVPSMMYAARNGERDVEAAARLLARDAAIARALITHRFPLEAAAEAFETARARASGSIKVVLEP